MKRSTIVIAALAAFLGLGMSAPARATTGPPGFVVEPAFSGASYALPLQILFPPDGRKLVVEMQGIIRVVTSDGTELPTPFLDLSQKTECCGGRGMLSAALDPDFTTNRWVYVFYVVDPESSGVDFAPGDPPECYTRIERYQASLADPNVADTTTRQVLLGTAWPSGGPVADIYHTAGTLRFAPDKSLLASTGDGAHFDQTDAGGLDPNQFLPGRTDPAFDMGSFRSRSLNNLAGKVLRLDKETGNGLPSNPFWDGNPQSPRSRIWVYGLRNPYRFVIRPGTGVTDPTQGQPGTLYIGETGWNTYEEVNVAPGPGINFGWPCQEGPLPQTLYGAVTSTTSGNTNVLCGAPATSENPSPNAMPFLWWHHTDGTKSNPTGWTGHAVIGGTFQSGGNYPAPYQGAYYAVDYIDRWVRWVTVDGSNHLVSSGDFLTGIPDTERIWTIECDPWTGDLYTLCEQVNSAGGNIYRIRYIGASTPAVASFRADSASGTGPYAIPGAATPWHDLVTTPDGALQNFAGTATSGWQGSGTATDPHRLQFDGVNDRVVVAAGGVTALQSHSAATAALWFQTGSDVTTTQSLYEWVSSFAAPYAGMRLSIANGSLRVWLNPWANVAAVQPNTWYHLAVAKDGAGTRVYVNGTLCYTADSTVLGPQNSELVFGCSTYRGAQVYGDYFSGAIAQVGTYDVALTGSEILANYEAGLPLYQATATKVVTMSADSASGTGAYPVPGTSSPWMDVTGGHSGTLTGFNGTTASGWQGDGSIVSPHRLAFDGIDDRVTIPAGSVPGLQSGNAATASIWFKTGADVDTAQTLIDWTASFTPSHPGMTIGIHGGTLRVWLSSWNNLSNLVPNTWYNVTVVKSSTYARVFLNGIRVLDSPTVDLGGQQSEIVLGAAAWDGPGDYVDFFHGSIGKLTLWRAAILDPEVQEYEHDDASTYASEMIGLRAVEVRADSADGVQPYPVPSGNTDWHDLVSGPDGTLVGFNGTGGSGWAGGPSYGTYAPHYLAFDGVDDHVTFPASIASLRSLRAASVSMWFLTGPTSTNYEYLIEWLAQYASPFPGMSIAVQNGKLRLWLNPWVDLASVGPSTWHHVVVVKDDSGSNVYLDGSFLYSTTMSDLGDAVSEIAIGCSTYRGAGAYGDFFTGGIGQVDIWPVALTPTDAQALFVAGMNIYSGPWSPVSVTPGQGVAPGLWTRPNPFASALSVDFALTRSGPVDVSIFDVRGRRVRTLVTGVAGPGLHRLVWNGRNDAGQKEAPGLFFARFNSPDGRYTRRIAMLR